MTELFLKKDGGDWQRVYFSTSGSGFRLTRENPYFTQSESYTLDVSLPTDILANRQFFGNLQRIDTAKRATSYQCRLAVDGKPMLDGTAKVTQVTESAVKIQLLGGNSELNFLSNEENLYIDEMDLGHAAATVWVDYKGDVVLDYDIDMLRFFPVYDETNGRMMNKSIYRTDLGKWVGLISSSTGIAPQPNLLYIIKAVIYKLGYTLIRCDIDSEPWNRLYVASAKATPQLSHTLPHWSVKDFMSEVCRFFNCTLIVDSSTKTSSIVSNTSHFRDATKMVIDPIDEYTAEIDDGEDSNALDSSNIEYDMSGSSEHTYDCISGDLRKAIPYKDYPNFDDALFGSSSLPEADREPYIHRWPAGKLIWLASDNGGKKSYTYSVIDQFEPLIRNDKSDGSVSLKICPVAMMFSEEALSYGTIAGKGDPMLCRVPSLENPKGNESYYDTGEDQWVSAQDLIEGNETIENAENEDRIQVMFADDVPQRSEVLSGSDKGKTLLFNMPFTDWRRLEINTTPHRSWSLALTRSDAANYLGQLHQSGFTFNVRAKHTIRFIADTMPDPNGIFLIRGKLYGCEKIEANVNENGFDKLMTGYFYEMTQ